MNFNITRKILDNYRVVSCGYCDLQYLLRYKDRIGRNAGVYGWNYDCFRFDNFMLVTGYRISVKRISLDREIINKYENKARKLEEKHRADYQKYNYDRCVKDYERLREKFEKEVVSKYFNKGE